MNLFHQHHWSEWEHGKGNDHPWKHAKTLERNCACGEVELTLLELDCVTRKRTGEYCYWCKPWVERWHEMIDKSAFRAYNTSMPYKTGSKEIRPLTRRNEALYEYIIAGHSFGEAAKKFDITRTRSYQIYQSQKEKREEEIQPA